MSTIDSSLISIVLPVYNERAGLAVFHQTLSQELEQLSGYTFEILYCNDGSQDGSLKLLHDLANEDKRIRLIALSRRFGKEVATTAGIQAAKGSAVVTLDSDGQHPVNLLPDFLQAWRAGNKVVIGMRTANTREGWVKRFGSYVFYGMFKRLTGLKLQAGATDYRLIDRSVQIEFNRLTEHNRITRGLIDWLGYQQSYIPFVAKPRLYDSAGYSFRKLCKLAIDSMISLSTSPLYVTAYVGMIVLPLSILLGLTMALNALFGDPLQWHATGGAYVLVLILFLIGIVMMSQGIIGLYLSHIHSETQNRPLYVVDQEASVRL